MCIIIANRANVVCYSSPGNPKSAKTEWTFRCKDNKWEKLSDAEKGQLDAEKETASVESTCNAQYQPEPKLGDVCDITRQGGNVLFGIETYTKFCYVYIEEGWVLKGSDVDYQKSCDEILKSLADTTPAE